MPFRPIDAADACIRRSLRLLDLSTASLPDNKVKNDLRRAAIVMAVAGIDAYMHWLVYQRISAVRREGDIPKSLGKLELPFTDFAALADATVLGRQKQIDSRPWVQVKHALQKRLLKATFQGYDDVATAFSWAGIEKAWTRVAEDMGTTTTDIKSRLNSVVYRRNQIVHEGDIKRALRPRKLKYNEVDEQQMRLDVDWVNNLIKAIERIVTSPPPASSSS